MPPSPGQPEDSGRLAGLTRAGIEAALSVARAQGLPADDPRLVSGRGSALVHLAPAPVIARVSTGSAFTRADTFSWLAREVLAAGYLSERGAPVVSPTALADPGPHRSGGLAVSLWTLLPASAERPGPAEVGRGLGRLHAAAAGFTGSLPDLLPIRDFVPEGLDLLSRERVAPPDALAALRTRHEQVTAELDAVGAEPWPLLHGDSHAGNLMACDSGWTWIDLEETCSGPREFDLAVMIASTAGLALDELGTLSPAGQLALDAYAGELGVAPPEPGDLAPFIRARRLEETVWLLGMAHLCPERYAGHVPGAVARALGRA